MYYNTILTIKHRETMYNYNTHSKHLTVMHCNTIGTILCNLVQSFMSLVKMYVFGYFLCPVFHVKKIN